MATEVIGYVATLVGISMYLPQIIKSWKTKQMKGVSFGSYLLISLCATLWATYGILIQSTPVILTNTVILGISIIILALKKKYG